MTNKAPPLILALDLATTTGFALGVPGEKPISGSVKFGDKQPTHEQVAAKCIEWSIDFLTVNKPSMIVMEAPLPPSFMRGHTTLNTSIILMGLPFLIGGIAYKLGIYRICTARVGDVRSFFIGSNHRSAQAERMTRQRCEAFGWNPVDDNAADALALWAYQASIMAPSIAHKLTPLFSGKP